MKDTFSGLFKLGSFVAKHKFLVKEQGAKFASGKELAGIFSHQNKGLLIDGDKNRISEKDSFEHLAVVAKPGSGKTTAFIIPNIFELSNSSCSMIVNDPSGEVYQLTSGHLKDQGFRVLKLSPDDLANSARFNPFAGLDARHTIEIEQVCAAIIMSKYSSDKEQIWNDGAISIIEVLAKCLAYCQPHNLNLPQLNALILRFGVNGKGLDDWVSRNYKNPYYPQDQSLIDSWISLTQTNEKMLSSYITICKTALKQLSNHQVQDLLSSDTIELNNIRKQKTIIYLNFPEAQQSYYQFIIDVFYARLFSEVMKAKPTSSELDIYCFLDEFGNSYIYDFSTIINNVRKYRVSVSLVFQGISQLKQKYGEDTAESIKAGIGSVLIYRGGDLKTTKEFAESIGKRVISQRENFTKVVQQYNEIDLLPADQLRTLNSNQALYITGNKQPAIIEYVNFFNHPRYARLAKKQPAQCNEQSIQLDFDSKLRI
jgi:type IV secretory pathway TraG/TraD family ATPase VirD4